MPSSAAPSPSSSRPTPLQRVPLLVASLILPLLSYALAWSSFATLLTWRHSQLIAGAAGGLFLLLLRALPLNPCSEASGKTPLSIAMVSLVGTVALALPLAHPELWSAASLALMLSGVTVWLWYPPRFFSPFRAAAQASVALSIAVLIPVVLQLADLSPWHSLGSGAGLAAGSRAITGSFDHSETLTVTLLCCTLSLIVAAWPNPRVPRQTQLAAAVMVAVLSVTALLFAPAIPLYASVAFCAAAGLGALWRAGASEGDTLIQDLAPRYRLGAITAAIGMLVAFSSPALLYQNDAQVFADRNHHEATIELDPSWESADPLPATLQSELRRSEWRAVRHHLPFGAGVGTWLDETLRYSQPVIGIAPDAEPIRQAGWPDQPRSLLAAAIAEHGVLAAFVWILMAIGGLLLARLVIRHSRFPTTIASVIGVAPAVGFAMLPGTSQMAPMYGLLLSWFLLCAPLARAEARAAARLVPAESSAGDLRKAPRGRIFILLLPAVVVAWFAFSHLRWSELAAHGYKANREGSPEAALNYFHRANEALPHPATLFNEARLLEHFGGPSANEEIESLYTEALRRRPKAPSYLIARAQWRLRMHEVAVGDGAAEAVLRPIVEEALGDIERALQEAPRWALAHQLRLECLILLDRLDEAEQAYNTSFDGLISPQNRNELRMLRIRMLAWKLHDRIAATRLLDEAEAAPAYPITRYFMQHERGRLVFWENSAESPYTLQTFHEGHSH